jgi:hypothetical protein
MVRLTNNNKKKKNTAGVRNRPGGRPRAQEKSSRGKMVTVSTPTSVSACVVGQHSKRVKYSRTMQELLSWAPLSGADRRVAVIRLQPGIQGDDYDPYFENAESHCLVGTPFPTAYPNATQYNAWRITKRPTLHIVTNLNFGQQAQVRVAFNPDPRTPLSLNFTDLVRLDGTMSCPANLNSSFTVPVDMNWRFIDEAGAPFSGTDPRWTDAGILYLGTEGLTGAKILTAYWDYEFEFAEYVGTGINNFDGSRGSTTMTSPFTTNYVVQGASGEMPAGALPLGFLPNNEASNDLSNKLRIVPYDSESSIGNAEGLLFTCPGQYCVTYRFSVAIESVVATSVRILLNGVELVGKLLPTFLQGSMYTLQCPLVAEPGDLLRIVADVIGWTILNSETLITLI